MAQSGVYLVGEFVGLAAGRAYTSEGVELKPVNLELMVDENGSHQIKRVEFPSKSAAEAAIKGVQAGSEVSVKVLPRVVSLPNRAPWIAYRSSNGAA
jgi:hypothetical protein